MKHEGSGSLSRYAVIDAAEEAWALDGKSRLYTYDGLRFWRRRSRGTGYAIVPSWRAPAFGWAHDVGCACRLCAGRQEDARAA